MLEEKFILAKPTPTDRLDEYLDIEGRILSWSASFPLPAIGARVFITVNQIGWAEVRGYFRSGKWVGVMTKPERIPISLKQYAVPRDAPGWMKMGVGCQFGDEIELTNPRSPNKKWLIRPP